MAYNLPTKFRITCVIYEGCSEPTQATVDVWYKPAPELTDLAEESYRFHPAGSRKHFTPLGEKAMCTHQVFALLVAVASEETGFIAADLRSLTGWTGLSSDTTAEKRLSNITRKSELLIHESGRIRFNPQVKVEIAAGFDEKLVDRWLLEEETFPPPEEVPPPRLHRLPPVREGYFPVKRSGKVQKSEREVKEQNALLAADQWLHAGHDFRWSEDAEDREKTARYLKTALHYVLREQFPATRSEKPREAMVSVLRAVSSKRTFSELRAAILASITIELALLHRYDLDVKTEYELMAIAQRFTRSAGTSHYAYWVRARQHEVFTATCAYNCVPEKLDTDVRTEPFSVLADELGRCEREGFEPSGQARWRAMQAAAVYYAAAGDKRRVAATLALMSDSPKSDIQTLRLAQFKIFLASSSSVNGNARQAAQTAGFESTILESSNLFCGALVRSALEYPNASWQEILTRVMCGRLVNPAPLSPA